MNLTKLFSINYAKENIKKSKGILVLMLFTVPILTLLILYTYMGDMSQFYNNPYNFSTLNIANYFGMFIIPVILSITLMGYVYKKNSVDFVNSMPLNRKQIYLTNIVVGIIYIILLQLLTAIFSGTYSALLEESVINTQMIFDSFIVMTLSYIFMFTLSSLALTISGNKIIQIVLILIILFIVPFTKSMVFGNTLYEDIEIKYLDGRTKTISKSLNPLNYNYTLPIDIFISMENGESVIQSKSMIYTSIISILFLIIGIVLFEKRKMENNGTSFINLKTHMITKTLTLYPIIVILYFIIDYTEIFETVLIISLVLIYYFVYDLITGKKVKIRVNLPVFILSGLLIFGMTYLINTKINSSIKYTNLDFADIDKIELDIIDDVYLEDKQIINLLLNNIDVRSSKRGENSTIYQYDSKYYENSTTIEIVAIDGNKEYELQVFIDEDIYEQILDRLSKDENYINQILEKYKIQDEAYIETLYGNIKLDEDSELKDFINNYPKMKDYVKQWLKEDKYNYYTGRFAIYQYINHKEISVSLDLDNELLLELRNAVAREVNKKSIKCVNPENIEYMYLEKNDKNNTYDIREEISYGLKLKIFEFMKEHCEDSFDYSKPYIGIHLNYYNIIFSTNKIEEFEKILGDDIKFIRNSVYEEETEEETILEDAKIYENPESVEVIEIQNTNSL